MSEQAEYVNTANDDRLHDALLALSALEKISGRGMSADASKYRDRAHTIADYIVQRVCRAEVTTDAK